MTLATFHRPETWDDFSRDYEQTAEPSTRLFALALAEEVGVEPGARVIDIACGPGALALHLAGRGAEVMAVDHSPAMVERLLARAGQERLAGRVAAAAMDGQALDVPDGAYDIALSAFGIFLFPDNRAGLREAVRVVRPGGRVGIATWRGRFGAGPALLLHQGFARLFPDRTVTPPSEGAAAWGDPAVLREEFETAGLIDVRVTERTLDWLFPSRAWIAEHAHRMFQLFPSWQALTPDERTALLAAMVHSLDEQEPPLVPTTALLAVGEKPAA